MTLICSLSVLTVDQTRALMNAKWNVTRLATLQGAPRGLRRDGLEGPGGGREL